MIKRWTISALILLPVLSLTADIQEPETASSDLFLEDHTPLSPSIPFNAYTGKVTRNRVRLRLTPSLEAPIVQELEKGQLLVVTGEEEEYYSVQIPSSIKGYLFRTFVLDNVVEGEHVNVRLEPNTEALIIGHVNTGDKVSGEICEGNGKWLQISPPADSRMYVYKDYLEKVGNANFLAHQETREREVSALLKEGKELAKAELTKPFLQLDLNQALIKLNQVVAKYTEFSQQVTEANQLIRDCQEQFLKKKIAYLETGTVEEQKPSTLQESPQKNRRTMRQPVKIAKNTHGYPDARNYTNWETKEQNFFDKWLRSHEKCSLQEFYEEQKTTAIQLTGILETYNRPVNNKPGDFVLLDPNNHLPIAYLYSTQIKLDDYLGKRVSVQATTRPNNHFAFPAYYVLSAH